MRFVYGFELEGFYTKDQTVAIPPKDYPTDGFPGLVEFRTHGGDNINKQYFALLRQMTRYPGVNTNKTEHIFSPKEKVAIRSRHSEKGNLNISNVYGKDPRPLGNKTLASFQINISVELTTKSEKVVDGSIKYVPPTYGLFDFIPIIRRLDEEFAREIKESKRQPGFYAVKDRTRLEYRSLPNSCAPTNIFDTQKFLSRITKCVEQDA